MNKKSIQRCLSVVEPAFVPGERVEMIELVQIGKVSAKRQIATAAVVGIASGGLMTVSVRPRGYYLVLTDQRLFLIDYLNGNVGKTISAAIPRTALKPGPLRGHLLTLSMEVEIEGSEAPSRFSWGRAQTSMARRVAAALGSPVPVR